MPSNKAKCQTCGGNGGVEKLKVFNTEFTVCAYCRHDALETLSLSYTWERPRKEIKHNQFCDNGYAVVFDGHKEIKRRGFGVKDHG